MEYQRLRHQRQLTNGPPTGLAYNFSFTQPTPDQLLLTYQFINNGPMALTGFQFMAYVNPFFGTTNPEDYATVAGSLATSPGLGPQNYQVGDSSSSNIFTNLLFGTLDDTNGAPTPVPGTNVAMAIGFNLGTLAVGQGTFARILLSDDGTSIGSLAITDQNPLYPGDSLTMSGVPEPSGIVLLGIGSLGRLTAGAGSGASGCPAPASRQPDVPHAVGTPRSSEFIRDRAAGRLGRSLPIPVQRPIHRPGHALDVGLAAEERADALRLLFRSFDQIVVTDVQDLDVLLPREPAAQLVEVSGEGPLDRRRGGPTAFTQPREHLLLREEHFVEVSLHEDDAIGLAWREVHTGAGRPS